MTLNNNVNTIIKHNFYLKTLFSISHTHVPKSMIAIIKFRTILNFILLFFSKNHFLRSNINYVFKTWFHLMHFDAFCSIMFRVYKKSSKRFSSKFQIHEFRKKIVLKIFSFFFSFFSVVTSALPSYIINETIILHDKNVFERFFLSETFQWKKFIVWAIKTVLKKAKNWLFHEINNIVTFSYYEKLTNQNSEMKNWSEWKNVVNVIKIWLKEKKKITIKIVATYAWRDISKKRQHSIDLTFNSKISFSNSSDIDLFPIDVTFRKKFKRKTTKHKKNKKKTISLSKSKKRKSENNDV